MISFEGKTEISCFLMVVLCIIITNQSLSSILFLRIFLSAHQPQPPSYSELSLGLNSNASTLTYIRQLKSCASFSANFKLTVYSIVAQVCTTNFSVLEKETEDISRKCRISIGLMLWGTWAIPEILDKVLAV